MPEALAFLAGATIDGRASIEADILKVIAAHLATGPFGLNFPLLPGQRPTAAWTWRSSYKIARRELRAWARTRRSSAACETAGMRVHARPSAHSSTRNQGHRAGCRHVITIQGGEGGGHTGSVPTTVLLPQVVDAGEGAGGRSRRLLRPAGAWPARIGLPARQGIAMGTRFLMTTRFAGCLRRRWIATSRRDDAERISASRTWPSTACAQRMLDNEYLQIVWKVPARSGFKRLRIALSSALAVEKAQTGMSSALTCWRVFSGRPCEEDPEIGGANRHGRQRSLCFWSARWLMAQAGRRA